MEMLKCVNIASKWEKKKKKTAEEQSIHVQWEKKSIYLIAYMKKLWRVNNESLPFLHINLIWCVICVVYDINRHLWAKRLFSFIFWFIYVCFRLLSYISVWSLVLMVICCVGKMANFKTINQIGLRISIYCNKSIYFC